MRQEVLDDDRDVVSALRQGLATRIGSERFNLWFGSNIQLELAGEVVIVSAPDEFTLERVRRQFARDIQTTLATLSSTKLHAEFRVNARGGTCAAGRDKPVVPHSTELSLAVPSRHCAALKTAPSATSSSSSPRQNSELPSRRRFARFESFIVGPSNKVAFTAAQSVTERLGAVSPLFLYGPTGSGKTHLLESICSTSRIGQKPVRSLILSAEQFTSFFLEALQGGGLPSFRRKVRDAHLLLIDDIQFFSGKRATLVEFQHTLDTLTRQGHQLVVSSDRAPVELTGFGPELLARLTGGLVCGLDLADFETRRGIARTWIARDGLQLPDEVAEMIALETNGDARQIQGALFRLQATSMALQQPITVDLARSALSDIFASAKRVVRLQDIERAVCDTFGLEPKTLREGGKSRAASQPRMLAMWLARKFTRMAFSEISEFFGRRSHTTVILAEQKVNRWVTDGARLQLGGASWTAEEAIRRLETRLRSG